MAKQKHVRAANELFAAIVDLTATQPLITDGNGTTRSAFSPTKRRAPIPTYKPANELRKMKKFRFQLLHRWLTSHIEPCRVADVGGGKGLLSFLLQQSGWSSTVIDPVNQALPTKYKDIGSNKQTPIQATESVPRIDRKFEPAMARHFDLLVAMHAHGCNIQLVDAALEHQCDVLLLPCCVIGEPTLPPPGTEWIQWMVEYVLSKGFVVEPFRLNFKGQNIGFYARQGAT